VSFSLFAVVKGVVKRPPSGHPVPFTGTSPKVPLLFSLPRETLASRLAFFVFSFFVTIHEITGRASVLVIRGRVPLSLLHELVPLAAPPFTEDDISAAFVRATFFLLPEG